MVVGDLVTLRYHQDGHNKWHVIAFKGHCIELLRADRKHPNFALVKLADINHTCSDTIKVYHPHSIGVGLWSWGEPPLKIGFAVAKLTSQGWCPCTLLAIECWKLQSLPPHTLVQLQGLGATDAQVAAAAGNAISGAMSQHVVSQLLSCYAQHVGMAMDHPALSYLKPVCFAPVQDMEHVVIIPVATSLPSCLTAQNDMWAISFSYQEHGRAHTPPSLQASKLASQLASQLLGKGLDAFLCMWPP